VAERAQDLFRGQRGEAPMSSPATHVRRRISVRGVVQGVGFRPFAWRRATRLGLAGFVENDTAGVTIEIEGPAAAVRSFLDGFAADAPPLAVIERIDEHAVDEHAVDADVAQGKDGRAARDGATTPDRPRPPRRFVIRESTAATGVAAAVPPDIAPCAACLAEIATAGGRRFRYPFTNCTDCGPRYTIIRGLPYDRPLTSMRAFPPCAACAAEYADPADRRFHAEPIACPDCGPIVWHAVAGAAIPAERPAVGTVADAAIVAAREALRHGRVLAVKGVGGFHLACDATDPRAVAALCDRKRRGGKPLAVMVAGVDEAAPFAHADLQERRLLESRERPIVLLRKRGTAAPLAALVAPGNDFVGVMLPFAPLHHLLCAGMPPLVMTSGNLADEPIVHDNRQAAGRLGGIADDFLLHDREIIAPCDDSVVRCAAGARLPIRRGRGAAPLPIRLASGGPTVLAVGGEWKAAVCLAAADRATLGPHVGDVGTPAGLDALARAAMHLTTLVAAPPQAVAADLHPRSLSAAWAARFAADRRIPLVRVQHHEAHVAALLAEHGLGLPAVGDRPSIGVCFDGTGYGRDGTIWGGEFFVAASGGLRRAAHVRTFPLPGGDASIRHPWRTAAAVLFAAGLDWEAGLPPASVRPPAACRLLRQQLEKNVHCAATSSMGRLFDAVAALAGVRHSITYEAEAAMNLEARAREARGDTSDAGDAGHDDAAAAGYEFAVPTAEACAAATPADIDWRGLVAAVARDVRSGVGTATIAARFHAAVATMVAETCARLRAAGAGDVVGLTGGVFQNALLVELAVEALRCRGFAVLLHDRVPANDGGLALGQAVLGRRLLTPAP